MAEPFTPGKSSFRLLSDELRIPVERLVCHYYGSTWLVTSFTDLNDRACHPAGILSDGMRAVFVKLSEAANGRHQFEVELAGLRLLSERAEVITPTPVGILPVEGGTILVLEAVQEIGRTAHDWREIGRTLARIHSVRGSTCGLETQGYFGALYQDNRPLPRWPEFFLERRLWPRLVGAIDSGLLTTEIIRQIDGVIIAGYAVKYMEGSIHLPN
jgi:protein-ribulosamine 3-kinase